MGYTAPTDIDPEARRLIRHKVRRLIDASAYTSSDEDDLAQELALHAHVARPKYDPDRGALSTFYDRTLNNAVRNLATAATRKKRDRRRERPLELVAARPARHPDTELKLDVDAALATLLPDDRMIASHLADDGMVTRVVRTTGRTRHEVRGARGRIAQQFAALGLAPLNTAPRSGRGGRRD
jgi:DNA-directed RNA polymerase specialized sigma24 family protein